MIYSIWCQFSSFSFYSIWKFINVQHLKAFFRLHFVYAIAFDRQNKTYTSFLKIDFIKRIRRLLCKEYINSSWLEQRLHSFVFCCCKIVWYLCLIDSRKREAHKDSGKMPTTCSITFDNPEGVFYAGQMLNGTVALTLTKEKKVRGVFVKIFGRAYAYWTEHCSVDHNPTRDSKGNLRSSGGHTVSYVGMDG